MMEELGGDRCSIACVNHFAMFQLSNPIGGIFNAIYVRELFLMEQKQKRFHSLSGHNAIS